MRAKINSYTLDRLCNFRGPESEPRDIFINMLSTPKGYDVARRILQLIFDFTDVG